MHIILSESLTREQYIASHRKWWRVRKKLMIKYIGLQFALGLFLTVLGLTHKSPSSYSYTDHVNNISKVTYYDLHILPAIGVVYLLAATWGLVTHLLDVSREKKSFEQVIDKLPEAPLHRKYEFTSNEMMIQDPFTDQRINWALVKGYLLTKDDVFLSSNYAWSRCLVPKHLFTPEDWKIFEGFLQKNIKKQKALWS